MNLCDAHKCAIVRMKSGGPKMMVEDRGLHFVLCVWMSEDGKLQRGEFDPRYLYLVDEGK